MNEKLRAQMKSLFLSAALRTWDELIATGADTHLGAEELIAVIINAECEERHARSVARKNAAAQFRQKAYIEHIDTAPTRGISKDIIAQYAQSTWIKNAENILITGATGTGKSYLACAIGNAACVNGHSVIYYSCTKFIRALRESHIDNTFSKLLKKLARTELLIIDDFGLDSFGSAERRWLFEIIEDRHDVRSTVIASQFPVSVWHTLIGDPTIADAILDRMIHNGRTITLEKEELSRRARKGCDRHEV